MTINNTDRRDRYEGNSLATTFAYNFKIFDATDLVVTYTNAADIEVTLLLNIDYSVNDVGEQIGSIIYPLVGDPLTAATFLTLTSAVPENQLSDLQVQTRYDPNTVERMVDRSVVNSQQLAEKDARTLRYSIGGAGGSTEVPVPAAGATAVLGWNAAGELILYSPDIQLTDLEAALASSALGNGSDKIAVVDTVKTLTQELLDIYTDIGVNIADISDNADDILANTDYLEENIPDFKDGGILSNNAIDAINDLDITAGKWRDFLKTLLITFLALTKQIDVAWAEGTSQGGFPSALTLTDGTWYRVFVIGKPDGSGDVGFDTDENALNLLADAAGYTTFRQIEWVYYVDGTTGIRPFTQKFGRVFVDAVLDSSTIPPAALTPYATSAPPNTVAYFNIRAKATSSGSGHEFYAANGDGTGRKWTNATTSNGDSIANDIALITNDSSEIQLESGSPLMTEVTLFFTGYTWESD